jgi:electron transport complex protein RnfG
MAKNESSLWQLVLSLALISAIAGLTLAAVFSKTKETIETARVRKKQETIMKVLPGFDINKGRLESASFHESDKDSVCLHVAYLNDQLFGVAVETYTNKAFNGTFNLMVGFDEKGNILQTELLQANETPGLGDKIDPKKSNFAFQFVGKNPENYKIELVCKGGDVVAITAATISSNAYCDAIARAYRAFLIVTEQKKTDKNEK